MKIITSALLIICSVIGITLKSIYAWEEINIPIHTSHLDLEKWKEDPMYRLKIDHECYIYNHCFFDKNNFGTSIIFSELRGVKIFSRQDLSTDFFSFR